MSLPTATAQEAVVNVKLDQSTNLRCHFKGSITTRESPEALGYDDCSSSPRALEYLDILDAPSDATDVESRLCPEHIVAGWFRTPGRDLCISNTTIPPEDATFIVCRPTLMTAVADLRVDSSGVVQELRSIDLSSDATEQHFSNGSADFIIKFNMFLLSNAFIGTVGPNVWHNDSYSTDFINFFMSKVAGDALLLDPSAPPPSFDKSVALLGEVYVRLFAILLGTKMHQFLEPSANPDIASLKGYIIRPETRLFVSKPLFIVSIVILSIYIGVSIIVYVRRPARFLPRFPTTIASVLAMTAASHAILDLRGTAQMSSKVRQRYLNTLGHRYGYGSFIGTDGKVHIGIERQPYLGLKKRKGTGSSADRRYGKGDRLSSRISWKRIVGWKGGKVREGGWI